MRFSEVASILMVVITRGTPVAAESGSFHQGREDSPGGRSGYISLASGRIETPPPTGGVAIPTPPSGLDVLPGAGGGATGLGRGRAVALVKFPGPVTAEQIEALDRRAERVAYLPHDAFVVTVPPEDAAGLADPEVGARWVGPLPSSRKVSPSVASVVSSSSSTGGGGGALRRQQQEGRLQLLLHVFSECSVDAVAASAAERAGGEVVGSRRSGRFSRVRLLAPASGVAAAADGLAADPCVFWIELEGRRVLLNDSIRWVAQAGTGEEGATPVHDRGIFGSGQIVGILDTGIDADMCYFYDSVGNLPPTNNCNSGTVVDHSQRKVIAVDFLWSSECAGGVATNEWDTNDHGTHVAGTVAGNASGTNSLYNGLAPASKLVIQDGGFGVDDCADMPAIGCPATDLQPFFQQAYDQGARIHTNSYGDYENNPIKGIYSAGSEDADEFMWEHKDFLLFFAAGNDGPGSQTVSSPSTAKNVVSVGATLRGSSAEFMASFSSCGPTTDGRTKPDITMPGSSIRSANADNDVTSFNCNTRTMSGTSMASPAAAGAAALVRQYYVDGFYPSGAKNPTDAMSPSAALMKATLVHSGHDMTGAAAIPSECQGWGRAKLGDALVFSGDARALLVEDDGTGFPTGSSGQVRTFDVDVGGGSVPLKATLAWTDYPSTPAADPNLVNDLDLEVTGPDGTATYLGNVFSGGESTVGGSPDRVNTVELVLLKAPGAGLYTITVKSFNIPYGAQPFALVVSTGMNPTCGDGSCVPGEDKCSCAADCGEPPATEVGMCTDGIDNDCDNKIDCDDADCSQDFACTCGDGTCDSGEDCNSCPADCLSSPLFVCGNGLCEMGDGENCVNCPVDCNAKLSGKLSMRFCCGHNVSYEVGCGDSRCSSGSFSCTETSLGMTCCGDSACQGEENSFNCALDCGSPPVCGDGTCDDPGENQCSCPDDCGMPPATEGGLCADGADNDCDNFFDCDDDDCSQDPACAANDDCQLFGDKQSCNAQSGCRWDNRNKQCVNQ